MPGTTLQQILGARNLTGVINSVVGGVPDDLIPPAFMSLTRPVSGNQATYHKVQSTRKTARLVQYGGTARTRELQGVTETPVVLAHFFESFMVKPDTMMALLDEGNETRQRMGAQTLARQISDFGRLFRNNRLVAFYSALARGKISYDASGNFALTDQAATGGVDVDFGVPAANLNQAAGAISASWATAGTKIINDIKALKRAARKATGYPLRWAFYGSNIPDYLLGNTQLKEIINRNLALQEAFAGAAAGEIPDGFLGFNWRPVDQAFYETANGTNTDIFGGDSLILTPEPSADWWEWYEGSYPVPTNLGAVFNDASAALSSIQEVYGSFAYATVKHNPVGIEGFVGDTVLPVLKVPAAIYILDVTP